MVQQVYSRPELARRLGAWWSGAQYLGSDGVELQRSSNDCGPTALKMVCDHYGVSTTGEGLAREMRMVHQGVTLRQLQKAAQGRGLACDARPATFSELSASGEPVIVLLRSRHFVVIDRTDAAGFVYARDPSLGKLRYSQKAFERAWTGLALIFYEKRAKSAANKGVLSNKRSGG
jgi:ABC-type bacteriocin/lantibiotic exporter with double-glycine peptidase domain